MRMEQFVIEVDGVSVPCPSKYQWGYNRVNAAESGRTDDTIMHANQIGQKRKLQLEWAAQDPETTSLILKAFEPEYIMVTYHDPLLNDYRTAEFYVGDRSAPVKFWLVDKKYYESISFNIIER